MYTTEEREKQVLSVAWSQRCFVLLLHATQATLAPHAKKVREATQRRQEVSSLPLPSDVLTSRPLTTSRETPTTG